MGNATILVSIYDIPEALAGIRAEFARVAREIAAREEPAVARRLRQIADAFEAGGRPETFGGV